MAFPETRLRRLRRTGPLRDLVRETRLSAESFVYPIFVCPGKGVRKEIRSMPGVFNLSVDQVVKEAREARGLGVSSVILFGLPEKKDEVATGAWTDDGVVQQAARAIKSAGCINTPILSYAAKFASGFYGPFREAADSAPQFGDRRSYQMDPANLREAMREIELDIEEGADMIMVKPALPYLDVIAAARERFDLPLAAYQVSGEYAMIEAAARNNWIERDRVMMESLVAIRRAGAQVILTYFAKDAARLLQLHSRLIPTGQ